MIISHMNMSTTTDSYIQTHSENWRNIELQLKRVGIAWVRPVVAHVTYALKILGDMSTTASGKGTQDHTTITIT